MISLKNYRVAVMATDGFEESELTEPLKALREAGAQVDIIGLKLGKIQGFKHHDKSILVAVDKTILQVQAQDYDALVLPGGALNADALRIDAKAQKFAKTMQSLNRPIAFICHAAWLLVSAGIVRGRTLTSYKTIQDDLKNAGAHWVDLEVVVDDNFVSSRQPQDIPAFNREMLQLISSAPTSKKLAA